MELELLEKFESKILSLINDMNLLKEYKVSLLTKSGSAIVLRKPVDGWELTLEFVEEKTQDKVSCSMYLFNNDSFEFKNKYVITATKGTTLYDYVIGLLSRSKMVHDEQQKEQQAILDLMDFI
jgi:hypothetical protein